MHNWIWQGSTVIAKKHPRIAHFSPELPRKLLFLVTLCFFMTFLLLTFEFTSNSFSMLDQTQLRQYYIRMSKVNLIQRMYVAHKSLWTSFPEPIQNALFCNLCNFWPLICFFKLSKPLTIFQKSSCHNSFQNTLIL